MSIGSRKITYASVTPRNNEVLIRMEFEESVMSIFSGDAKSSLNENPRFFVAAVGPKVTDLPVGTEVFMKGQEYSNIEMASNPQSISSLHDFYKSLKPSEYNAIISDKEKSRVKVVQYGLFPEFTIKAIVS